MSTRHRPGRATDRVLPRHRPGATPLPTGWLAHAATASPETPLPEDMSDGTPHPVPFRPWDGSVEQPVDRAIQDTRTAVYPLHGLDPCDPRD